MHSKSQLRKDFKKHLNAQKKAAAKRDEFYTLVDVLLESNDLPSFRGVTGSFKPDPARLEIDLHIPYDPPMMHKAISQLEEKGWVVLYGASFPARDTMIFHHPRHKIKFYLWVKLNMEGATCERVKIGEEKMMKPIYEIICKEGTSENVFETGASDE